MDSEAVEQQTCVLKVPIHCEGCKKKVKKVFSKIPGVLHSDIDSRLNKVTVTGTIDADSIIKRLIKSNKHAEHWPDERPTKPDPKPDPNTSTSNESKQKKTKSAVRFQENPDKKVSLSEESAATPAPESAAVSEPAVAKSVDATKAAEPAAKPKMAEAEAEDVSVAETVPKNDPPEKVADSPASEAGPKPASTKKKGKKVQKKLEAGDEVEGSEQTTENSTKVDGGSVSGGTAAAPVNRAVYQQPMHQAQPVHAYNMARPTTSNSYYAPAPVPTPMPSYEPHPHAYSSQQAYAHSSHLAQPESYYSQYSQNSHSYSCQPAQPESFYGRNSQPETYYSPYSAYPPPEAYHHHTEQAPPAAESYDMFSDENPNACQRPNSGGKYFRVKERKKFIISIMVDTVDENRAFFKHKKKEVKDKTVKHQ